MIGDVFLLKSGTDFQDFSNIKIYFNVDEEQRSLLMKENEEKNEVKVYYAKSKKMFIINERVTINEKFERDMEIEEHI